jgi:hypothetical protein
VNNRLFRQGFLAALTAFSFWAIAIAPGLAHWADLATADILVNEADVKKIDWFYENFVNKHFTLKRIFNS